LPGNPVSTVAGFYRYVKPYLYAMQGLKTVPSQYAKLAQDYVFEPTLTLLLTVQATHNTKGELIAQPFAGKGSGDYANLRQGNGFLELPEERTHFKAGEAFPFWSYR
jgi:molybdopterin molybdotransferase